jgi:uncharacterized repeat protein (TIGR03803 family)
VTYLIRGMKMCGVILLWSAVAITTPAQSGASVPPMQRYTVLHSFDYTDGYGPIWGLEQGTNGNLYGTTFGGGCGEEGKGEGCGTVFTIAPNGQLKTLYVFCSQGGDECTDGLLPRAGVVQGTKGKFYGTTGYGGAAGATCTNQGGCGTIFSITTSGARQTLYSFCSQANCTDGGFPFAGLVQGTDVKFYGTTAGGGNDSDAGTVFSITANGALTTLYSFCTGGNPCKDGESPAAGLVQGTDGKFYGTTEKGGADYSGTVFSITADGKLNTLYSFCSQTNCADGEYPVAVLVQGTDGNLYGTNDDTVFRITLSGKLTTVYRFCSKSGFPCPDGEEPAAGLVEGSDGNFYGTTEYGGTRGANGENCYEGCGTIFRITPKGKLTTLYDFCSETNCVDGLEPLAGLVQDTNGTFYGTAGAGANGDGVVFSLSMGLGPFVATEPTYGKVGTAVKILGTDLSSVTNVRFNGIEAQFTIVSASEITATVPKGATTGPVRVITPTGKLQSNVPFRVK